MRTKFLYIDLNEKKDTLSLELFVFNSGVRAKKTRLPDKTLLTFFNLLERFSSIVEKLKGCHTPHQRNPIAFYLRNPEK